MHYLCADALRGNMESAVVEDDNDPNDSNNNSSTTVGDCINNTILATGVFTSAELYRLARAPITSLTAGHQRSHHMHQHSSSSSGHQLPPSQLLAHHHQQQLQAVKLEQEPNQSQYCSINGTSSRNTNGFSPDPHPHHSHQMMGSPNPIPIPQSSVTGSSSTSSSPSYVVGMSQVSDLPPHKRLRRMHAPDGDSETNEVRGHPTQLHHQQSQYSWTDGHSDSDVSLIKSESSAGSSLYAHLHVSETPLSPHPTLYHHMQQSHISSVPHHHHHVHQQQQQQQSQQQVLKYQENGDTLSDFVNLVSALSCPSDGHFWPGDQSQHQASSHHGSDPSDEIEEAKSLRDDQQEDDDMRDHQHVTSHQLQVMAQYGHLSGMQLPPPPPPPTARPVVTPVTLDSRWNNVPSPPAPGYLMPEKDVSLGYFRPAFFVSQGLSDSSAQLMLMPQQQHQHSGGSQQDLSSSPDPRSHGKGSPSPPQTPS